MTEKQQNILKVALEMFAKDGFASTSTSKIAKAAGVSEGLIFRHFTNKDGLLKAIMDLGGCQVKEIHEVLFSLKNPKDVIRTVIDMPFSLGEEHHHFWRLLYALKWQADMYDASMSAPIKETLVKAFTELKYENPSAEAEIVLLTMDGLATALLLRKPDNKDEIRKVLLDKYEL